MIKDNMRINELRNLISSLPNGSISKKNINGKTYYYHRYKEGNKRIEKYIDFSTVSELQNKIEKRRMLEKELKRLISLNGENLLVSNKSKYNTNIRRGENLFKFIKPVDKFNHRFCFDEIVNYLDSDISGKVLLLYGLRRTGKTTLIKQAILNMNEADFKDSAYIQILPKDTLASLNEDLVTLEKEGVRFVFIDEVTLLSDFIEGASLFSDIYASSGMKIVLSGTDSLGFMITKKEQLYDRSILVHTTYISYKEFKEVLGIEGIDEYIKYGGTMCTSGSNYSSFNLWNDYQTINEYVDTSIAKNIQHSLNNYQDGNHFRHLQDLHDKNELTNIINRVVEDINHRFTKEVILKDFKSNDLRISKRNLRKDKMLPNFILDKIDEDKINMKLAKLLDIINEDSRKVLIDENHLKEIEEYLELLNVIYKVKIVNLPSFSNSKEKTVISQPGLRFNQATHLASCLLEDGVFSSLSVYDKSYILYRIENEIKGRMLEDLVLLETKLSNPSLNVFKIEFSVGEFDMVVVNNEMLFCDIYEIKYSDKRIIDQTRHLNDIEKCLMTEFKFGSIRKKCVIYQGETTTEFGVEYINVDEFLTKGYYLNK